MLTRENDKMVISQIERDNKSNIDSTGTYIYKLYFTWWMKPIMSSAYGKPSVSSVC